MNYDDYLKILQQPPSVKQDTVPQELVDSIMGVESGGDPNALSPQGARGRMQVTRPAWIDYGDGTPFEQATDEQLRLAALAKLRDDYQYYGGDAAKTAAAYIGGRGAVLRDGTIRNDVADAHGTTPAAYSQRVIGRLGVRPEPQQQGPDPLMQMYEEYMQPQPAAPAATKPAGGGVMQDLTQGLKRSAMVEVPDWVGRAAQWFGAEETGKKMRDFAKEHDPLYQESEAGKANSQWWNPRGNVYEAASQFLPSQAIPAAGATVGFAFGGPVGALIGYGIGSVAQLPIFYGSAAQGSYEAVYENLTKKGYAPEQADIIAKRTARLEGASEVGTEFAGDAVALLAGSKITPTGAATGQTVKSLLKPTVKSFLTTAGKITGAEVGEEVINAVAQPEIRARVGQTGEGATWDQTLSVIMPTALSMLPLGGAGGANLQMKKAQMVQTLEDPSAPLEARAYVAQIATKLIEDEAPETARAFSLYAGEQLKKGAPITIGDDALYLNYAQERSQEQENSGTTLDAINQKRVEYLQGQMDLLRREAGVDKNNGDIYATSLGEQYQWLESELAKVLNRSMAADVPQTPEQDAAPGEDIAEPMRPYTERAMYAYATPERAQTVADSMSKVQNSQYVVMPHPRMPGKFAVVPAEWNVQLPERTAPDNLTQDQISERLQQAADQAPDNSLEAQMRRAAADRALQAIEARGGVASPVEAQIIDDAGLGQPYDRIDPTLAPTEQQTQPRERIVVPPQQVVQQEARAAEKERLDAIARGEPVPAQLSETEIANTRLEQAAQQAEPARMDEVQRRLMDAAVEGKETAQIPDSRTAVPKSGIILPEERETAHPIPFSQPPAPVTIAGKPVRDMSDGELQTYATSEKPDIAAKAQAEIKFRAAPAGSNMSLPFGAGYQTHRLANVTTGNAPLRSVSERASLGPDLGQAPNAFTRASNTMVAAINDAVADLVSAGMPETWLWGVRNIATHSSRVFGATVRGRFSSHYEGSGRDVRGVTLQRSLLESMDRDETVPYQVRGTLAHEFAHGLNKDGVGHITDTSPLFDAEIDENGELVPVGPIMREVLDAFKLDLKGRGPLADLFHYPLQVQGDLSFYKDETFAQLSTLYLLNPTLMQERLPTAFALFEEIKNATRTLQQDSARGGSGVSTVAGRERSLTQAVRGAFRARAESAGSPVSRGVRGGRYDSRSGQDRQGTPGTDAAARLESPAGDQGQLLGSNQGFKGDERLTRRPKNVDDITDDEFDAEIKKIGNRIAGLKSDSTVAEVRAIAKKLEAAAKKGIEGKEWYEKSAYAILAAFHGDTYLAEKFIQAIAITSAGTELKANFTNAVKAWEQFARGDKIHVATDIIDKKLTDLFYFGKDWDGRKTNTFYLNLTEAMYGHDSGFSTQDMHMGMLAFGTKKPTDAQYEMLENLTRLVANTKNLRMKPRQLQAAAWVTQKSKSLFDYYRERGWLNKLTDKQLREHTRVEALINYADLAAAKQWIPTINERMNVRPEQIRPTIQNVTMETIPSEKTSDYARIGGLSLKERTRYSKAILTAVPIERIAALFGLDSRLVRYDSSTGGYNQKLSPNFVVEIGPEHFGDPMTANEVARVRALAQAMMYVYRQDAVPFFRADPSLVPGEGGAQLGIRFVLSHDLTEAKEKKLFARMMAEFGKDVGFTQIADNEIVIINYRDKNGVPYLMDDLAFYDAAERLIDAMDGDNPIIEHKTFGVESEYPEHDWQKDPAGEDLLGQDQDGVTGRSDLQTRLRAWRKEAESASSQWLDDYDQRIAGSNEGAGAAGRIRADGLEGDGGGVRVAIRPQKPDGQEVTGIHYSHAAKLTELQGKMYGTGINGAERRRLSYDPSIRPRVYFYLDQDTGVLPRPEPGLGAHVYRTTLTNMYPVKEDPAKVFPAIKGMMDPEEKANEMERRIIAAGYDGYINRGAGMAVVLTDRGVKTEYLGRKDGKGGIEMAGSNLAIPADTSPETMTALVQEQIAAAGSGNIDLFPLGHSRRVALYATELGRAMGLNQQELSLLTSSAMLHDIGKVTLPEPVLNKHGKLTDEEHKIIEQHTTAAEKLLSNHIETIQSAAAQHHENWDGTGYPHGLAGEQISKYARIIAVADVFDALTSDRPYKNAWTSQEALKQLREWSGSHFEPGLVDRFAGIAGSNNETPLWYSELARSVEAIKQPSAPVGQWLAIIDNLTTKGVKGDEIEWSGVREWLQMQAGKVTKDQILQYLNQNGVQIEETVKGKQDWDRMSVDDLRKAYRDIRGYEAEAYGEPMDRLSIIDELKGAEEDGTQYSQYTLPGGENYRELLLTLPETPATKANREGMERRNAERLPKRQAIFAEYEGRIQESLRAEDAAIANNDRAAYQKASEETVRLMDERDRKARREAGEMESYYKNDAFISGHFEENNILAHVRFDERTDADGKRVLFIEEIQSDWGQQGKRNGFGFTSTETKRYADLQSRADNLTPEEETEWRAFNRRANHSVPQAPFVGKTGQWVSLALKRMIRWAADNGFDRIAWTTGEQQAARYDLSKQIDKVEVFRLYDGLYNVEAFKDGKALPLQGTRAIEAGQLEEVIGKELAERAVKDLGNEGEAEVSYSGLDLKVGGTGMKDFYDKIVPNAANVLLKKLGGERVKPVKLPAGKPTIERAGTSAYQVPSKVKATEQIGFDITDKMREQAQKGMPLFAGSNNQMPEWLAQMPQADQEAAKRAGVYLPKQTWRERLQGLRNGWKERFAQGMFDQFAPVKALDERAYILDRMTKGADAGLEALLMYGTPYLNSAGALDVKDLGQGGVIQLMSELNGEHDRFLGWIAGNRAQALKLDGRENNLTDTDISALRNWNQGMMADGRNRATVYADVHRRFNRFNAAVLDVAEKAGLFDANERQHWEEEFYVPFYRVLEDQGYDGPRDVGSLVNQYAFKRLRGGKERLNDLFENTLRNWNHLLGASLKNQAAQATIEAAERAGVAVPVVGREKGAVSFRDNGTQRWYQVEDPLILDAITSLEWAGISGGPAMKMMQKAKHYLTFGVTLAPAFKIRNLIRDQVSAVAQNPVSGNMLMNLAQGWKLTSKEEAQYAHMLAGGGLMRFGTSLEGNRSAHTDRLVKMAGKNVATTAEQARNLVEKAWDAWQELGDRSENVTRAAVYRQVFDKAVADGKGQDEAHLLASYAARDSMDFGLQGSYAAIRLLSQVVPFFNARLQGLYKMGREGIAPTMRMLSGNAKAGDRAKAIRFNSMAAAVSMASVLLMLSQEDDDDWKAREDWDRDTYWWIKVGGTAWRIPKPFELGAIGSLAERGVEMMRRGMGPEDRKLFTQRFGWMLANALSFNPTPQLVKPLIDLYANTNSFTGRPIETAGMEKLSKSERIGPNTSQLGQLLGQAGDLTGLSPVQIDSLINGYFSWLGANILWASDFALRPAMGAPEKATGRIEDIPVLGSFARELPAPQSRYVTLFYENADRFGQLAADIQHYQKLGLTEKAMELYEERKDDVALAKMYERVQRQMGALNREIRRVQVSDLPSDEKRERLDELNANKNELARMVEEYRRTGSE